MTLPLAIIALCAAFAMCGGGLAIGRHYPSKAAVDAKHGQAVNGAYDDGWEDCAKHYAEAADVPAYPELCPDPGACVKGPDPHPWTTDCEQDEGWADLDDPPNHPVYRNPRIWHPEGCIYGPEPHDFAGECRPRGKRLPDADERTQMFAELAPDDERPAGHTDQFRAIDWDRMPWSERQGLIEWDFVMKSRRLAAENDEFMRDYIAEWRAELENRGVA